MRKYEILTGNELNKIHESTLDIMENLGVKFTEKRALDIFYDAGFVVDKEGIVKFAPQHDKQAFANPEEKMWPPC